MMDFDTHHAQPARVPFRTVLASIVGLWLCYFLLVTLRSELLDLGFEQEMLWRRAIFVFAASDSSAGRTIDARWRFSGSWSANRSGANAMRMWCSTE